MQIIMVSAIHLRFAYRATLHVIVMRGHQHKPRRGPAAAATACLVCRRFQAGSICQSSASAAWRGEANHDVSGLSITSTSAGALNCTRSASEIHLRPAHRATLHVIVMRGPKYKPRRAPATPEPACSLCSRSPAGSTCQRSASAA
jgi:hypothetical protein